MEVSVDRLRIISDLLLNHLENHGGGKVDITADFYWDVPEQSRYDTYQEPRQHTIGQLSDDLNELNRIVDGSRPVTAHALVWFAAVLRRIGETASC